MDEEKVCYNLWITKQEEKLLKEILKKRVYSIAWTIIKKAFKRGDFKRDETKSQR